MKISKKLKTYLDAYFSIAESRKKANQLTDDIAKFKTHREKVVAMTPEELFKDETELYNAQIKQTKAEIKRVEALSTPYPKKFILEVENLVNKFPALADFKKSIDPKTISDYAVSEKNYYTATLYGLEDNLKKLTLDNDSMESLRKYRLAVIDRKLSEFQTELDSLLVDIKLYDDIQVYFRGGI